VFGTERRGTSPIFQEKGCFLEGGIGMQVRYLSFLGFNGGMQGMVIQKNIWNAPKFIRRERFLSEILNIL